MDQLPPFPRISLKDDAAKSLKGLKTVDLCSGMGGFSIAASRLGMTPIVAADIWEKAAIVYRQNFPRVRFFTGNILDPTIKQSIVDATREAGGCDVLLAGPPCQGFSQVRNGRHVKEDPRNRVVSELPRYLASLKPRAFMIENVPAMLGHDDGKFARRLLARLRRPEAGLQYSVSLQVVDAASFGVPQQRRRAILIGVKKGQGSLKKLAMPDLSWYFTARRRNFPLNGFSWKLDQILQNSRDMRLVTVQQAIGDLPRLAAGAGPRERKYRTPPQSQFQRWVRTSKTTVSSTSTPRIKKETARRVASLEGGECVTDLPPHLRKGLDRKFMSAYRRLNHDLPSTTLFTKYDCAFHPTATRALSVREYARLQSIPDNVKFSNVAPRHAYAMIGNAVPPLMIARILASRLRLKRKV